MRNGNFSPIIGDLDRSLAFYEGLLGLQVPPARDGQRPFFTNPGLHRMFGTTGFSERHTDARIPGTSMGIEMIEYHDGIGRTPVRPRHQDPGAVTLVLLVRDVDATHRRLTARGANVLTPGGKPVAIDGAQSVLIEDPDGRPIELRQPTVPLPSNAPAGSEIVGGRLAITVADLDKTAAVFRDVLGFQVGEPTAFVTDRAFAALSGVRGARIRRGLAQAPGTAQVFEFMEFTGLDRTPIASRIQDPGSVRIQMMVRGIDEVAAAMTRAGARIVSDDGRKATLPPNFWGVMTVGPDNLFLSLLEPCPGPCATERPVALPAAGAAAATDGMPVPALISALVTGPAKMYPDPAVSVVPGAAQVEDFPVRHGGVLRQRHRQRRRPTRRASSCGGRRTRRSRAAWPSPKRCTPAGARSSSSGRACRSSRGVTCSSKSSTARPTSTCSRRFNAERYAPLAIAPGQTNEILAQVGRLVKSGGAPFAPYRIRHATLMGTSASSGTVRNYFPAHAARGCPVAVPSSTASC